jgi:alanyl-tRNA synthetase
MDRQQLTRSYIEFFKSKNHKQIPNASLIPENDPTVLFTTAGMHPLVPYLLGEKHPQGKRLVDVQKCIRTGDIDDVGDASHHTFFEMLGNWSLGDYWKKEAIEYSYEFLTKHLKIDKEKISVTCFEGDKDAPKDSESEKAWLSAGIPKERIYFLGKKDNWWGPAGQTGPCGPDSEMFLDTGKEKCSKKCQPGCSCGKYVEIWNDVFMEYNKTKEGKFEKLKQQNVDTGMGVERTVALLKGHSDDYMTDSFKPSIEEIEKISKKKYDQEHKKSMRIIADHIRAAVFILGEDKHVKPSNVEHGYVLRRLIRRAVRHGRLLDIKENFTHRIAEKVIANYKEDYHYLEKNKEFIITELKNEEEKFSNTLEKGLKQFERIKNKMKGKEFSAKDAFDLYQSFGLPIEVTKELAKEAGLEIGEGFEEEFKKHQELSRTGSEKKFKSGLADASEDTVKLHTATHMLNQALRNVFKKDIHQLGSNITPERLRFDFNFDRKLTDEELKKVEDDVNKKIKEGLKIEKIETTLDEAKKMGAQAMFTDKYGEKISVYKIGGYSIEVCTGPHVQNTKELGHFKIVKEEAVSAGVRRIKAILEKK